ncbi:hypothetical protein TNCV_2301561 [Trichonephila clavipes]|nr:hypothetical protein TNCV_2301561 [Trichonephila clavipes]
MYVKVESEACIKRILSSRLVSREWDNRNRWCDGQVCPEVGQEIMTPWSRRLGIREKKEKPCPGSREVEESAKERDLVRDWGEKEGKTMKAGGVEE